MTHNQKHNQNKKLSKKIFIKTISILSLLSCALLGSAPLQMNQPANLELDTFQALQARLIQAVNNDPVKEQEAQEILHALANSNERVFSMATHYLIAGLTHISDNHTRSNFIDAIKAYIRTPRMQELSAIHSLLPEGVSVVDA